MSRRSAKAQTATCVNFFFIVSLLMSLPAAARAVTVGEFPIAPASTLSGVNSGLAADAEGNIWFPEISNDRIGRITPAGGVTLVSLLSPGRLTGSITLGPDGNIWATKEFGSKVLRITPAGIVTEFPLFGIDSPGSIAAGADGNLWFTAGSSQIGRMTPSGEATFFSTPTASSFPRSITPGPDGNLWFVETAAGKIGRITPEGAVDEFPASPSGPSQPVAITAGPDGNLWFIDGSDIVRMTPAGVATRFSNPSPSSFAYGITAGPDGNLWFADNNRHTIGRITPAGTFMTELAPPSAFSGPQQIVASPDGLLWFTESINKIGVILLEELSEYFPLATGTSWTYQKNGIAGFTRSVTGVDGTTGATRILFSDGSEMYMSNDAYGIRDHKEFYPDNGMTVSLNPPFVFADSRSAPGVPVQSSGTASIWLNSVPYTSAWYSASSTIQGMEMVTVPAGTFRAVKLATSIGIGMTSDSQTIWVAPGVGVVKEISSDGTYLLTGTSVQDKLPDRFLFAPRYFLAPGSTAVSETITVTGITAAAPISISGGEYRIGNGAFTASPGTVTNGETVTVRQTASDSFGTAKTATLNVGGFNTPFKVMTWPRPAGAELPRAIAVLRLLAGMAVPDGQLPPDATADGRVGLAEALMIFQQLAGLRR